MTNKSKQKMQWYRIDLHLHTPGSSDYQEPSVTYLDILRRAELRGLDIIAFTDHNTINGYAAMMGEVEQLELLVRLERATREEQLRYAEYRRLLDKVLVLPGFEFTATFGFHILGIFSPQTKLRQIEHILLRLNIPPSAIEEGNSIVGASADVLTAYREINNAGGLVIAAHVNSAHGVAMRGFDFPFGGQTKIAYTQDAYLHCLEVTDLDKRGRFATSSFFNGSKTEYPRPMRCIQGSDAHRLLRDGKNLGVGDRVTEMHLPEASFEAMRDVLRSNDFSRTRAYRGASHEIYDYVHIAREAGPSNVQSFYDTVQHSKLYGVMADICAFANTNGGTIYVGATADITIPPIGAEPVSETMHQVREAITQRITPRLSVDFDTLESHHKSIVRIQVPRGSELPYMLDETRIYVRKEAETVLAPRHMLIDLVRKGHAPEIVPTQPENIPAKPSGSIVVAPTASAPTNLPRDTRRGKRGKGGQSQPAAVEPAVSMPPVQTDVVTILEPAFAAVEPTPEQSRRGKRKHVKVAPVVTPPADGSAHKPPMLLAPPKPVVALPTPKLGKGKSHTKAPSLREVPTNITPNSRDANAPRNGVEIIGTETRKGEQFHIMRDLRRGIITRNVTQTSARDLWAYAIKERENNAVDSSRVEWAGIYGLWKRYEYGGGVRYDLVLREQGQPMRIFYGVTEKGMHGAWHQFVLPTDVGAETDDNADETELSENIDE